MYTIAQHVQIGVSWLASFFRANWEPEHYPIELRLQKDVPPEAAWAARVPTWPGPIGFGATKSEARTALLKNLRDIAMARRKNGMSMPRPGTRVPIEFASTARVQSVPDLLEDFTVHVLGFGPADPVFISDASSVSDFGDENCVAEIRQRIKDRYGVVVTEPEPVLIADVLDRIRARHSVSP